MQEPIDSATLQGLAELRKRLDAQDLQILQHWEERPSGISVEIGMLRRTTTLTLSSVFLRDLPNSKEYQKSLHLYAGAVAGRMKAGPIDLFYCRSNQPVFIYIDWPLRGGFDDDRYPVTVALTRAVNAESEFVAMCAVHLRQPSNPILDSIPAIINSVRAAIDSGEVQFYPFDDHPKPHQRVILVESFKARSQKEVEEFVARKTLVLGQLSGVTELWTTDPWDAAYLGVSPKDLLISTRVLRGEDLLRSDTPNKEYASCTDKLVTSIIRGSTRQPTKKEPISRLSPPTKPVLESELEAMSVDENATLIVIDLDNFKAVNDTYKSHTVGDQCLDTVVNLIAEVVGRRGKLYRWGQGDEFAILLYDASTEEALPTAERIRRSIDKANPGKQIKVTASVGVCGTDGEGVSKPSDIIELADKAVYQSKETGKNRVTAHNVKPI